MAAPGGRSGAGHRGEDRRDSAARSGRSARDQSRGEANRDGPPGLTQGRRFRGERRSRATSGYDRDRREPERKADGPQVPDDVTGRELDKFVHRQLSGLPVKVVERVAAHLVMAGRLTDEDPETAYAHAKAARTMAARVAVVREAVGETAYACARYAEALAELRAAKRMNGSWDYLPIMADCERALERPERAVALSQESGVSQLDPAGQVEIVIVAAGARRDMGQLEAALQLLESAPISSRSRQPWVARLRYAYADALEAAGRTDEAISWFHRTVAADVHAATDADDRLAALGVDTQLD